MGDTRGQFHKTLWIRKLRICSYGQILTVNLLINWKNSVIYGEMAINYEEKSFMEQAPGLWIILKVRCSCQGVHGVVANHSVGLDTAEIAVQVNMVVQAIVVIVVAVGVQGIELLVVRITFHTNLEIKSDKRGHITNLFFRTNSGWLVISRKWRGQSILFVFIDAAQRFNWQ